MVVLLHRGPRRSLSEVALWLFDVLHAREN